MKKNRIGFPVCLLTLSLLAGCGGDDAALQAAAETETEAVSAAPNADEAAADDKETPETAETAPETEAVPETRAEAAEEAGEMPETRAEAERDPENEALTETERELKSDPESEKEPERPDGESEEEEHVPLEKDISDDPFAVFSEAKDRAVNALADRLRGAYADAFGDEPYALMASYDTEDIYIEKAAYIYDNAAAALAFISEDRQSDAELILDAFRYATEHDRYENGRLRNAYMAGDIVNFDGAALPGWWDDEAACWNEDQYQVGSNTGNMSWAVLAMLAYDRVYETDRYLETAETLMNWILENCTDGRDGFIGGIDGWPENGAVSPLTYRSTEHNIDAFAAFRALYEATGDGTYYEAAESARRFLTAMYDPAAGCFYTGTEADGVTVNASVTVLDAQCWAALAFGEDFEPYLSAFSAVEGMRTGSGGYAFSMSDTTAAWSEGTAFAALAHRFIGETETAIGALNALLPLQTDDGLFKAADVPMDTGMTLFDGSEWYYGPDPHVASTAWFILAVNGMNPFGP